jgi:hypothetical protein
MYFKKIGHIIYRFEFYTKVKHSFIANARFGKLISMYEFFIVT